MIAPLSPALFAIPVSDGLTTPLPLPDGPTGCSADIFGFDADSADRQMRRLCLEAVMEERERLGGMLHDSVLQTLNAAGLTLACLRLELMAVADLVERAPEAFVTLLQHCQQLEKQLHLTSGDVRGWLRDSYALPAAFAVARQPNGCLGDALRWLVTQRLQFRLEPSGKDGLPGGCNNGSEVANTAGQVPGDESRPPVVRIQVRGEPFTVSPTCEIELLAVAQEAMINAHRHGHARRVFLDLEFYRPPASSTEGLVTLQDGKSSTQDLKLTITDDGVGVSRLSTPDGSTEPASFSGFGIGAMRRRIGRLGGTFSIEAALAGGRLRGRAAASVRDEQELCSRLGSITQV